MTTRVINQALDMFLGAGYAMLAYGFTHDWPPSAAPLAKAYLATWAVALALRTAYEIGKASK